MASTWTLSGSATSSTNAGGIDACPLRTRLRPDLARAHLLYVTVPHETDPDAENGVRPHALDPGDAARLRDVSISKLNA